MYWGYLIMDTLSKKHPHVLDSRIKFDEPTHTYSIDGNSDYLSVTTWVHSHFKPFETDKIIDKMMNSRNWTNNKYFGKTREEIKMIWEENRLQAASAGTLLHLDIERYYNKVMVSNTSIEYQHFINFTNEHNLIPYRTEWTVFDTSLKIAGSIDITYIQENGDLMIYDWKRSKEITRNSLYEVYSTTECINHLPDTNFWHYALQLNMYKFILERNYNKTVSKMCLVCLHPNQTNYKLFEVPELNYEISQLVDIRKKQIESI
jgi:ATP-dependent exoDNAse (exonuclease V) beta subunit